jgi:hypothetical protein
MGTRGTRSLPLDCNTSKNTVRPFDKKYIVGVGKNSNRRKRAILVAMADESPFDLIRREIYPELESIYGEYGFETYFVYGRRQSNAGRYIRRKVEELRWNRSYLFLRAYDYIFLSIYKFINPRVTLEGQDIKVGVPEDLRHLSIKVLHATKFLESKGFEIVVRTTASSLLNPRLLNVICDSDVIEEDIFYGGRKVDQSDGFSFVSGSFTIFNGNAIKLLFQNRHKLDYSLIDDVCFGKFFKANATKILNFNSVNVTSISDLIDINDISQIIHFRCKTGVYDRKDIEMMKILLKQLKDTIET